MGVVKTDEDIMETSGEAGVPAQGLLTKCMPWLREKMTVEMKQIVRCLMVTMMEIVELTILSLKRKFCSQLQPVVELNIPRIEDSIDPSRPRRGRNG